MPSTLNFSTLYPLGGLTKKKCLQPRASHLGKEAANRKKVSSTSGISSREKGMEKYCSEVRRFDPRKGIEESPPDSRAPSSILIRGLKVGPSEGLHNRPKAQSQG
jgi:hypothetical protein